MEKKTTIRVQKPTFPWLEDISLLNLDHGSKLPVPIPKTDCVKTQI